MNDFVAYTSRGRTGLLALGAAAFVVIGLWMGGAFGSPPVSGGFSGWFGIFIGWFGVLFFGLCLAVFIRRFFDTREQLRIGPAGIRSAPWSDQTIPWSEIVNVTTWGYMRQRSIILHLRDPARFPGRGLAALLAGANRKLTGGDIGISLTGTDRSLNEAMSAIESFRRPTAFGDGSSLDGLNHTAAIHD
jgi:hypothetical protein